MLRSLWLTAIYLIFIGFGASAPFILALGYVWVDIFQPQAVAYMILNQVPVALIMGAGAVASFFLQDLRNLPRLTLVNLLQILIAIWSCATLLWAVAPSGAVMFKWDWAFKAMVFAAFLPWVIRSKVHIESFVQVYVISLAANFIPFGIKTLISGGGYGTNLGLVAGNGGLAEGGQLSTVCLMAVPLALHLAKHNTLLPVTKVTPLGFVIIAGLAVATALGTFERSALIGLAVLAAFMFAKSKNKLGMGIVLVVLGVIIVGATSATYLQRMNSIGDYQSDDSALTRLAVWKWTLEFSISHPFGGSFNSFLINSFQLPNGTMGYGRAFHSSHFEVLGELGWPGVAMYHGCMLLVILQMRRIERMTKSIANMVWCADLANAIQTALVVFLAAGSFVGLAFLPMIWYIIAMSVSLSEYVRRAMAGQQPARGIGAIRAAAAAAQAGAVPVPSGWRNR